MKQKKTWRLALDLVEIVVFALVLSWGLRSYVVEAREVISGSMLPTIQIDDRLITDKLFYKFEAIKRGDVIVFHPPAGVVTPEGQDLVKRVIGLPGEKLEVKNGRVYINDQALNEPYIKDAPNYSWGPQVIPPNKYFVAGDNRNDSYDSHYWGFLSADKIVGKMVLRYWPLDRFGALPR